MTADVRAAPGAVAPRVGAPAVARGRAADLAALAVLAGIVTVVAWNRFVFDTWLTRFDLYTFFLPWYHFLGERLRVFDVPGWNPHLFSGAPFAGDPESGWMYLPAMLLFALISSAASAFKAMVAMQLVIAAVSTYAFARGLGMGAAAALVAAVVYVTGPFLHWNTYCCLIFGQFATWIPLALLGIELSLRAGRKRVRLAWCLVGGFAVSQMLGGWIGEGWLYAMLLPAAYIAYRALLSPPERELASAGDARVAPTTESAPSRLRAFATSRLVTCVATGIAVLGSGLALAAAGVLPRLAVNPETNLAGGDYAALGEAGVLNPPWQLDYLLAQTLGTGSGYHFRAAAFGGAAAVLSLLALPLARRRFAAPFFAALTLVAMVLTLDTTPLHQLFYLIPRYREFHDHDAWRTIALAAIGPAILSGAAIEALPAWRGRRALLPIVFAPLLALLLVDLWLRRGGLALGWQPLVAAALVTLFVALVVATPVAAARASSAHLGRDWLQRIVPILVLVVAFVLPTGLELTGSWLGWPANRQWERHWRADPGQNAALLDEIRPGDADGVGAFLQHQLGLSGPFRYAGYGGFGYRGDEERETESYMGRRFDPGVRSILVNGRPIYLGLYDIQGYNPLHLARYDELIAAINGVAQDYHTAFLLPSGLRSPLLDLLDVRYIVLDRELPRQRDDVVRVRENAREVFRTPRAIVYERKADLPHAWIVHDVRSVARGEALPLLASGAIDPYQTALIEGPLPAGVSSAAGGPGAGSGSEGESQSAGASRPQSLSPLETARVTSYEPDRLTIETDAAAPGLLIVSEIYVSGWRATVDGVETAVVPTHHALRGVPLPAGQHTVELRYEPLSLRVGVGITALTAVAMLAVFAAPAWTQRSRRARLGS